VVTKTRVSYPGPTMNANMGSIPVFLMGWAACALLAGLTWFFSSRPRLYTRVFVPRDEWQYGITAFVRDPDYKPTMCKMALLQFTCLGVANIIGICLQLR